MSVEPIPDGYRSVTPYLTIDGASTAIEFYKKAFGARERMRMPGPGGKVMHAEITIGDSAVMLADEFPEMGGHGPLAIGGSPVTLMLYVEDVDSVVDQAVAAGATLTHPVLDKFYGDRSGGIEDPFGHKWHIATHKEDLTPQEIESRMQAFMTTKCSEN
ncbi:MAG: VOC family protein [Planctomycetia bacterium]|nr:VOC family protein [Planctomycetia bacterium]